ncbi:hypothetical protein BU14_0109s0033 [Porphyra umbilicalis]|uniref:Mannose-P-dolichol utilization defect 1 protein homolog n=1 Tax=Porphyra umbilicalis TaxID=2786 RepID=A0A1X6PCQ9_PORUM|nr:hypothetical protein BU14_0109s0033 [Porphyra umbilicalis]|eukprot:OSX78433.1 hypothetical protein BU14_0109s0033 [Porphyra umbilicalis]
MFPPPTWCGRSWLPCYCSQRSSLFWDKALLAVIMQSLVQSVFDKLLPPACPTYTGLVPLITTLLQDRTCFRAALSKGLGLGIVAAAGLIKLPQIASIVSSRSAEGLSKTTFLVETFGHTYNLAAHVRQGYPPSTYGDFAALLLQNYALLVLIYAYSGQPALGVSIVVGAVSLLGGMCSGGFPLGVLQALTAGNVLLVFASRLPQAIANYRAGSTGALSLVTCVGMWLGATARIFTTLTEVDDPSILAGYIAAGVLNGIIAMQVLFYRGKKSPAAPRPATKKTQ